MRNLYPILLLGVVELARVIFADAVHIAVVVGSHYRLFWALGSSDPVERLEGGIPHLFDSLPCLRFGVNIDWQVAELGLIEAA